MRVPVILTFLFSFVTGPLLLGQEVESPINVRGKKGVDTDFLFHYYEQDGNNSAVTGGRGTEELTDVAFRVISLIPLDSLTNLNLNIGANIYTSASTDNIDSRVSSASRVDERLEVSGEYQRLTKKGNASWSGGFYSSIESDYLSFGLNGSISFKPDDPGINAGLLGRVFFDRWIPYFPEELRDDVLYLETDKRNTVLVDGYYGTYLNPNNYIEFQTGIGYQWGLLSTPFHRVYIEGQEEPDIERFPSSRFQWPTSIMWNSRFSDRLLSKFNYRFYVDDFGILAHTFEWNIPIRIGNYFTIQPGGRYHDQEGSKYFAPFSEHTSEEEFYTSDFDLSSLWSYKVALGLRYKPLWFFGKNAWLHIRELGLRLAYYSRSDGLDAFTIGLRAGLRFY